MRNTIVLLAAFLGMISCKSEGSEKGATSADNPDNDQKLVATTEFGSGVQATDIFSAEDMAQTYEGMEIADTLQTSFEAEVTEVCQMKGCWMKLDLGEQGTAMVRFKDYGFFMPKDLAGKKVIVEGKAFLEMMSVEDQRHYAADAGASAEEIEAIKAPGKTFAFEAAGVRIK